MSNKQELQTKAAMMTGQTDLLLGRWASHLWALTEGTHTSQTCAAAGGMNAAGRLAKKASSVAATSCGPARRGMARPSSSASLISLGGAGALSQGLGACRRNRTACHARMIEHLVCSILS